MWLKALRKRILSYVSLQKYTKAKIRQPHASWYSQPRDVQSEAEYWGPWEQPIPGGHLAFQKQVNEMVQREKESRTGVKCTSPKGLDVTENAPTKTQR